MSFAESDGSAEARFNEVLGPAHIFILHLGKAETITGRLQLHLELPVRPSRLLLVTIGLYWAIAEKNDIVR